MRFRGPQALNDSGGNETTEASGAEGRKGDLASVQAAT
jgi:hypothetical protein